MQKFNSSSLPYLTEGAILFDTKTTVSMFKETLVGCPNLDTPKQLMKLAAMLANTWWYNVDDMDAFGGIRFVYLLGFSKAASIAYELWKTRDQSKLPENLQTYTGSSAFYPQTDERGGGAMVVFDKNQKVYTYSDLKKDPEKYFWFYWLQTAKFRLANEQECCNLFIVC